MTPEMETATCWVDDDGHHMTPCSRCDGSWFGTDKCRPARCPICEERGHASAYIRVIRRKEP